MTKTSQILALRWKGLSNAQIAERVGCRPEYVRAVWQRADHPGRYNTRATKYQTRRYRTDEEYADRRRAYYRERWRIIRALEQETVG